MSTKRVMIGGAIGHHPIGGSGNAWAFLQYVLGFRALGIETYYVEHLEAKSCWDAQWSLVPFAHSVNAQYFAALTQRFGLDGTTALLDERSDAHIGLSHADVLRIAGDADLFINISG
ncbi:MAG TPA: hypothetical protein VL403_03335, partial [Candidatus Kryptonia bacterium]|nr:hypothetical protein [Candidatus Kryptonia bacterium]